MQNTIAIVFKSCRRSSSSAHRCNGDGRVCVGGIDNEKKGKRGNIEKKQLMYFFNVFKKTERERMDYNG